MTISKSAPKAALLHEQNDPASETALDLVSAGKLTNFFGFLVEEPVQDPLYLHVTDADDNTLITFECGTKFGRDGQFFALKASTNGLKAKLSTSRSSVVAPAFGTTLHIWYSA